MNQHRFSAQVKAPPARPKTFPTPDAAAQAVIQAAADNNITALKAIFGPGSKAILTCFNRTQDAEERVEFARLARSNYSLEKDPMNPHRVMLDVGPGNWPFSVPIVEKMVSGALSPPRASSKSTPALLAPTNSRPSICWPVWQRPSRSTPRRIAIMTASSNMQSS